MLNNLRIRNSSRPSLMRPRTRTSSGNFYTSEIGGGGVKFWSRDFLGGFDFCPQSIIPVT